MNVRKYLLIFCVFSLFLCNENLHLFAMTTGFSTEDMDIKEQKVFISNKNFMLITKEPQKQTITCFDVNDSGLIIIGSENSTEKTVCVYNADKTFKYGYSFSCNGSFGIEWDGNNILIYLVRGNIAVLLDSSGNILELKKIQDTIENNSYWNHRVYSKKRIVNDCQYVLKNNMGVFNIFASSYSQLIKIDNDGNSSVVYDVSNEYRMKVIIIFIAVVLFIILVVFIVVRQFYSLKKTEKLSHRQ